MTELKLNIITPFGVVFDEDITSISIKAEDGERQLCKNYASTVGLIKLGIVNILKTDGNKVEKILGDGIFLISENILKIITPFCYDNNDETIEKIQNSKKDALNILSKKLDHDILFQEKINIVKLLKQLKRK